MEPWTGPVSAAWDWIIPVVALSLVVLGVVITIFGLLMEEDKKSDTDIDHDKCFDHYTVCINHGIVKTDKED